MVEEGFIEVPGGRVWYGIEGGGDGLPLLCLHGGPGFTHHSVASMRDLADERPVVFFDQLGCGKSDRPTDPALWSSDRYVEEVEAVRIALDLQRFHMMGNSWGGMLTTRYNLDREPPVAGLLLVGTPASMPRYIAELPRLRSSLPADVWEVIDRHEERGFTGCPEYVAAMVAFYKQHLCRLDPWPEELELSFAELGEDSYVAMNGPSEFNISGAIKDWDVTGEIQRIEVPVLVLAGRHDELSPEAQEDMAREFPKGEFVVLENGAHMPFFDDREPFMAAARDFLSRVERG